MHLSATQRGILALVVGIAVFSLQDVILKRLSGDYPLYQAMIIRSLTAVPLLLIIVRVLDGRAEVDTPSLGGFVAQPRAVRLGAVDGAMVEVFGLPAGTVVVLHDAP